MPIGTALAHFEALAAPTRDQVKITAIKAMQVKDPGTLVKSETDAGVTGYGPCGGNGRFAREVIASLEGGRLPDLGLIGKDPLAIQVHFHNMFYASPQRGRQRGVLSGIDIALWDLAGKIIGAPISTLLGGPFRESIPMYSHGLGFNMLDKASCRDWAQRIKEMPEGFTAFKNGIDPLLGVPAARFAPTLTTPQLRNVARGYANCRDAVEKYELAYQTVHPGRMRTLKDPVTLAEITVTPCNGNRFSLPTCAADPSINDWKLVTQG